MTIQLNSTYMKSTDSWESLKHYKVVNIEGGKISLRFLDDYFNKGPILEISIDKCDELFLAPYTKSFYEHEPELHYTSRLIKDLASSCLRKESRIHVDELQKQLMQDERLIKCEDKFILECLKSLVAFKTLLVWFDNRKKEQNREYYLELSSHMIEHEKLRTFAGTFANELSQLSERVRNLISHTGSVGTYRENLLQILLRKSIPERYHVATGFIYGCPRQLDIVIYDRIDYAPLFREGDLVVVPVESVRAVIEVKTSLGKVPLRDSLALLDQVSVFDDCKPPFFKGIFGFESELTDVGIYKEIFEYYTNVPDAIEDDADLPSIIYEPFHHVTSVCVLGQAFAFVDYVKDEKNEYMPTVISGKSATGLASQSASFLQLLLTYLNFGGVKITKRQYINEMLGADTKYFKQDPLASYHHWGAYFQREEMDGEQDSVDNLESHIEAVQRWLQGEQWNSTDQ